MPSLLCQQDAQGKVDDRSIALPSRICDDAAPRHSKVDVLPWDDVQRWDDGSGRITVVRSETDVEAQGATVAITPAAMSALDAIRPVGVDGRVKVFGLSESQIARRVKVIARAAGLPD